MKKWLWFTKDFKSEFGISDVRSNYSRVYSWMANQLGHLTLGLGTLLVFYWFVELVESAAHTYFPADRSTDATFFGIVAAAVVSAFVVVWLAKRDYRFMFLSLFAVLGNVVFTPWVFCADGVFPAEIWPPEGYAGICGVAVIIGLALLCVAIRISDDDADSFDKCFYIVATVCLSAWFASACWLDFVTEWKVAAAGAISAMAIWTAKEFAGDMQTVRAELNDARERRCKAGSKNDQGTRLNREFRSTALWDSRTDAMFYLAGAWIGAGVISDVSATSGSRIAWAFDLELFGFLFFLAFFVFGGRNWAYRQQAVDRSGAERANMMAVIDFCVELYDCAGMRVKEPRLELYKFARKKSCQSRRFDHVVVFGAGSLNERLADALVTEGALASLPPRWFAGIAERSDWRRARKISFGRLCQYDPVNLLVEELPFYPLKILRHGTRTDDRLKRRIVFECGPAGTALAAPDPLIWSDVKEDCAADLVVVTRCDPTRLHLALNKVWKNKHQNTVWFFEDKHGPDLCTKMSILQQLRSTYGNGTKFGFAYCK